MIPARCVVCGGEFEESMRLDELQESGEFVHLKCASEYKSRLRTQALAAFEEYWANYRDKTLASAFEEFARTIWLASRGLE